MQFELSERADLKQPSIALLLFAVILGISFVSGCVTTGPNLGATDSDKDGQLDVAELEAALTRSVFDIGDSNKDGKLSKEEVRKAAPERPDSKFALNDKDKSGYLSYGEVVQFVDEEGSFDKILEKIDLNGDSIIDPKEAGRFHDAMTAADRDQNLTPLERYFAE
tara:strand:- start:93 stop:587 length:495 start_codon:yes stop_codon:yes gene_type:complete